MIRQASRRDVFKEDRFGSAVYYQPLRARPERAVNSRDGKTAQPHRQAERGPSLACLEQCDRHAGVDKPSNCRGACRTTTHHDDSAGVEQASKS